MSSIATVRQAEEAAGLRQRIGRFFYASETPYGLALVRVFLPWAVMCAMLPRWPFARELYSLDGAPTPLWYSYGFPELLPILPAAVVVAMHSALLLFLFTTSIGWRTRFSVSAAFLIYTYLNLADAVSTMTKYSVIASHALLLLSLSHCGAVWSLDSWLKRRHAAAEDLDSAKLAEPRFPVWPRRLLQLLVGTVYFGAAITKMHTPAFFSGDQLQTWMITHVNFGHALGEYLALFPAVLVVFAYITVVWEVLFIFLAWRGWARVCMLSLGVIFHSMTTLTLGLYIFPLICISTYLAFLNENDVRRLAPYCRQLKRIAAPALRVSAAFVRSVSALSLPPALRFPSPVVFVFATLLAVLLGVEIEYRMDPYGKRRPEGPYALRELDAEVVESTLLGPSKPMRQIDKFVSIDTGTVLIGGLLADRRGSFQQGETVTVQCTTNPPHEDMWVECNLHDAGGGIISRSGQVVPRETLRCNFYYELADSLEPGLYFFVLEVAGKEIMRKQITIERGAAYRTVRAVAN